MAAQPSALTKILANPSSELIDAWLAAQRAASGVAIQNDTIEQSRQFISALQQAAQSGQIEDIQGPAWSSARQVLSDISAGQALRGAAPTQTATFVFSLKGPLFALLKREVGKDADRLTNEVWATTLLIDKLGLFTMDVFQKSREDVIRRQQSELLELSTPVVQLWDSILALPLIGTLDSERTQIVMESLLQQIVEREAEIAIIDITGVPTVDTLVAQHLLKTVSAARLMGADCIISGIRPQIAQTMVHLGVELNVVSKASLADAFALALRRTGKKVTNRSDAPKLSSAASRTAAEE